MTVGETVYNIADTLSKVVGLSNVYGGYGPDSNFKLIRNYDNGQEN